MRDRPVPPQLSVLAAKAYRGKTVNPAGAGTGSFELVSVEGASAAGPLRLAQPPHPRRCGETAEGQGRWAATAGPARVAELLDRVGLDPSYGERRPHELSGGQCQRAGSARVLASDPHLPILDEPVSAPDPSVRAGILNLLADLQDDLGFGYLFICHDHTLVRHFADRTVEMRGGRVRSSWPRRSPGAAPR